MTSEAADALEPLIFKAAASPTDQQLLQARQCRLRCLSLLCFGPLETLSASDGAAIIRLMVLIKNKHIFLETVPAEEAEHLNALHMRCHNVTTRHAAALSRLSLLHPDQVLTLATASIVEKLAESAVSLTWQRLPGSGCFEAMGSDNHFFSVNTLDGTVLVDGLPPSRLPKSILTHPLFRRSFGDRDFEVARTASGVLEMLKPIQGCFYTFNLIDQQPMTSSSRQVLIITETNTENVR